MVSDSKPTSEGRLGAAFLRPVIPTIVLFLLALCLGCAPARLFADAARDRLPVGVPRQLHNVAGNRARHCGPLGKRLLIHRAIAIHCDLDRARKRAQVSADRVQIKKEKHN